MPKYDMELVVAGRGGWRWQAGTSFLFDSIRHLPYTATLRAPGSVRLCAQLYAVSMTGTADGVTHEVGGWSSERRSRGLIVGALVYGGCIPLFSCDENRGRTKQLLGLSNSL